MAPRSRTGHWPVDRIPHSGVLSGPLRQRMASIRAIKSCKVCRRPRILVAGGASGPVVRDSPPGVVEGRRCPVRGRVAGRARAGRREAVAGMVRYISSQSCRALPLGRVAAVAIGRRDGRTGVAKIAGHRDVRPGHS